MNIAKMERYKKNKGLTYEEFSKKQMKLFGEWHIYYREHALNEFESLIKYRTMLFWDQVDHGDEEGWDFADMGLTVYLIKEIRYQLEQDKQQNYYEKELAK